MQKKGNAENMRRRTCKEKVSIKIHRPTTIISLQVIGWKNMIQTNTISCELGDLNG